MSRLALVVLIAALAACGKSRPGGGPTADELGAEAATFAQVLVPLSTQTLAGFEEAVKRNPSSVTAADFPLIYEAGYATIDGRSVPVMVGYANPWLAPADVIYQPMSVPQFLRACQSEGLDAVLIAPKGRIFISRLQLEDVRAKVVALGAPSSDMPFSFIRGNLR